MAKTTKQARIEELEKRNSILWLEVCASERLYAGMMDLFDNHIFRPDSPVELRNELFDLWAQQYTKE